MFNRVRTVLSAAVCGCFCLTLFGAAVAQTGGLIVNGDFEGVKNGSELRKDSKGQDWYESRKDTDEGREQLKMSTKNIGGNKTHKAMIKAHPELNTYLSQPLAEPQTLSLNISYDIYIKEILADDNRSAFFFLGGIGDKKGGPNSTGKERFVFLGFENAATPGKINLFVREGDTKWEGRTIVAADLDLETWLTIDVAAHVAEGYYTVAVRDVSEPFEVESFYTRGKTPGKVTHISFASWNDGAGTFYVDNVSVAAD